jgi:ribonuclease Z
MRAQNVLLTHFSSRYPTLPRYVASSRGDGTDHEPTIALAMDHACIRLGDLWKMARYLPAIEQNFRDIADEGDEEEEAALIRASLAQ